MRLTGEQINKAKRLRPGETGQRIILDPRGIHHKTMSARDFTHSVTNHAEWRKVKVAESLFIVERLSALGAISQQTKVDGQGAVVQSFRGTRAGGYEACHTMPCQLVLGGRFPHQLVHHGDGYTFNNSFLSRAILLFAHCTWQPKVVNSVDQVLDWYEDVNLKESYLDAVRAVVRDKAKAKDAYLEYAREKVMKLDSLLELVRDTPLTQYDAMLWSGALTTSLDSNFAEVLAEVDRLLTDKALLSKLHQERETVIEVYAQQDRFVPHVVVTGELQQQVNNESWSNSQK